MNDLIFILSVSIKESKHKELWKECVRCIRIFYKEIPIIIIIDNCDIALLEIEENDYPKSNIIFIKSEFNGAGEFLPYYYFYKLKLAKKAIFLQDSIFIKKPFDEEEINEIENIRFLWYFSTNKYDNYNMQIELLSNLNYNNELIELYNNENLWNGCMGSVCIITLEFLELLENKYKLFNLITRINNREKRCCLERLIAIISFNELKWNKNDIKSYSIYGFINEYMGLPFQLTFEIYKKINLNLPLIKCWNSR